MSPKQDTQTQVRLRGLWTFSSSLRAMPRA